MKSKLVDTITSNKTGVDLLTPPYPFFFDPARWGTKEEPYRRDMVSRNEVTNGSAS
jgi:hypothetical protein